MHIYKYVCSDREIKWSTHGISEPGNTSLTNEVRISSERQTVVKCIHVTNLPSRTTYPCLRNCLLSEKQWTVLLTLFCYPTYES